MILILTSCGDVRHSVDYKKGSLIPTTLALEHLNGKYDRNAECVYYPTYLKYQNKDYFYKNLYFETYILFGKNYIDVTPKKLDNLCSYAFENKKNMTKFADGLSSVGIKYMPGGWLY